MQLTFVPKVSFSCFFQRNESRKNRLIPTLYGNNIILRVGSSPSISATRKAQFQAKNWAFSFSL
nr:MAG TPA: hypothetical protein [Caudoviricetes sp.]